MIEVKNLTKTYGSKEALSNVSFTINDEEIVGLLGPNGAGKTTTMNIITGYLSGSSGSVSINGFDILDNPIDAKKLIGYLPEQPPLYFDMTVKEYLEFVYDLKGCKLGKAEHIEEIISVVKLKEVFTRLIGNLSKGYRQRVGLAQALIGAPAVLILDEPTVGLDPKEIIEIRHLIKKLGKSRTVIISSHILSEIQAVCDRIIVINDGKLITDSTADNITKSTSSLMKLSMRVAGEKEEVIKIINSITGVKNVEILPTIEEDTTEISIDAIENVDIRKPIFFAFAKKNLPILYFKPFEMTFEDAFIKLVDKDDNNSNVSQDNIKLENGGEN
ncbi:MAG: ATP-binding cassette domain-containing protein [Clostridia bacterium]